MDADSELALARSPELLLCLHVAPAVASRLMQLARVDGAGPCAGLPGLCCYCCVQDVAELPLGSPSEISGKGTLGSGGAGQRMEGSGWCWRSALLFGESL